MHRIQVQLTEDQERMLRELSALRGVSISALIREGVDALMAPAAAERGRRLERFRAALGKFSSGLSDISENHDEYFVEAILNRGDDDPA